MKVTRLPNGSLLVESVPVLVSIIILACLAASLALLVDPLLEEPARYDNIHVGVFCLAICGGLIYFLWERTRFVFDPVMRRARWERTRPFRRERGEIDFAAIKRVTVERVPKVGSNSRSCRVELVTAEARVPLTTVYSQGGTDHKALARTIEEFIRGE